MMIVSNAPKTERKKSRKNKAIVNENASLLPKTQESDAALMISMELHPREQFSTCQQQSLVLGSWPCLQP
ncbi:hypothetical protein Ahy_B02g058550 [Arachis hypogaea]|uniref:Uncharacterized protein n=1 Tax=Arachis hypogaea TaxID=3818 RepID=A0A445AEU3_ARAHY|nr:hypothetical protein Ahy_B02g058550 [Arachis hypogaea]